MKKVLLPFMLFFFIGMLFTACQKDQLEPQTSQITSLKNLKGMPIEGLSKAYFQKNPTELKYQAKLIKWTNNFFATLGNSEDFSKKQPCHIQPIYAHGIEGVAYYELWFTEDDRTVKAWVLISTTDKDYPIVNFSLGIPYSSRMLNVANANTKVYRFGPSYFTTEKNGQKIAEYGAMPSFISNANSTLNGKGEVNTTTGLERHANTAEPVEGEDFYTIDNYETLKQIFPANYYTAQRAQDAKEMTEMLQKQSINRTSYSYRWVNGSRAYFTQIPKNTSPNNTNCWAGCNNNAWANVYAWWDKNKGKANLIPTTSTGETSPLYRTTSARKAVVDPVQMSLYSYNGTYCSGGTGWTSLSNIYKGYQYAYSKGYGYNYRYCWGLNGWSSDLANIVTEGIANRNEEVLVAANSHMYVGYGWAQDPSNTNSTWAYCYPGWSTNDGSNVWIWWKNFSATTRMTVY